MRLTKLEEEILDGDFGEALQEALRMIVNLGDYHGAEELIPIKNVHVAGISYKTIGEVGLKWLEHLRSIGIKKKAPALNPADRVGKPWAMCRTVIFDTTFP